MFKDDVSMIISLGACQALKTAKATLKESSGVCNTDVSLKVYVQSMPLDLVNMKILQ